jgi:hypothetical protein
MGMRSASSLFLLSTKNRLKAENMINHDINHRALIPEAPLAYLTEEQLQLASTKTTKQGITLRDSIVKLGIASET